MLQPPQKSKKSRLNRQKNRTSYKAYASTYQVSKKRSSSGSSFFTNIFGGFFTFLPFLNKKSDAARKRESTLSSLRSQQSGKFSSQFTNSTSTDVKVFFAKKEEQDVKNETENNTGETSSNSNNADANNEPQPIRQHKHVVDEHLTKVFFHNRNNSETNSDKKSSKPPFFSNPTQWISSSFFQSVELLDQQRRYWFMKFGILKKINVLISSLLILISLLFISYISFFDTYFLVKNYQVEFTTESYLSEQDTQSLLLTFSQNNLLGILPGNQFWYLNNQHLTQAAQRKFPDIQYVYIKERVWPNTAVLVVATRPILLTLNINQDQYWRISQTGDVLTRDDMRLKERLVAVKNEIVINNRNVDAFKEYSFKQDNIQKEKFWFIDWLWQEMDTIGIKYAQTQIVSLYDTDVIVQTAAGTELRFDSRAFSRSAQHQRLVSILKNTTLADQEKDSQIRYIDFRIPGKVFVCRKDAVCS